MSFTRHSQTELRRRWILQESLKESESTSPIEDSNPLSPGEDSNASSSAEENVALMEQLPRISHLIPQKWWMYVLIFLLGASIIAGLEVMYAYMPLLAASTSDGSIETIDLDAEGSLAVWYSSSLLSLSCLLSLMVYSIRKRQVHDYRGRYRIWLWAAACWTIMSIDETASLHEGFKEMMVILSAKRILGDGSIWWIGAYMMMLIPVGVLLLFDMRKNRLSQSLFCLTGCCYVTAIIAQLGWIPGFHGAQSVMIEEGCEMAGNLFILLTVSLHARFLLTHSTSGEALEQEDSAETEKSKTASNSSDKKASTKRTTKKKSLVSSNSNTAETKTADSKTSQSEVTAESKTEETKTATAKKENVAEQTKATSPSTSNTKGEQYRVDDPEDLLEQRGANTRASRKKRKKTRR